MSNNKLREYKKRLCLCATLSTLNPPITLKKNLTIDTIDTPGLTING
ncbi:MAG: hypothetical protein V7K55_12355 [Nostoc sp.]